MYYQDCDLGELSGIQEESYNRIISRIENSKRIVLKFGTDAVGAIFNGYGKSFSEDVAYEIETGREFVIVSSGAIGLGKKVKQIHSESPIIEKSIYASLGQPLLIGMWRDLLGANNIVSSQVLYENENLLGDSNHREYIKNGLESMINNRIVPIANENDAVTSEEIKADMRTKSFGDNDNLARLICELINADLMIFFTNSGGIYKDISDKKTLYKAIFDSNEQLVTQCGDKKSENGRGGLASKLKYSIELSELGIPVVIASSETDNCLERALYDHHNHTIIIPKK